MPARRPSRSAWRARALHLAALGATGVALHLYARVASPGHMLAFVALVPWLAALDRVRSARAALLSGLLMSGIFALSVFAWFGSAMASYAGAPTWLGFVLLLLLAPLLQPQLVLFGWARYLAGSPAARGLAALHRALAGAFVYVAAEWTLPKLFADTLGHGLHPSLWLRQGADVAGASGLTLALLLFNEAALRTLRGWRRGKVQAPGVRSAPGGATLADRVHAAIRPAACALVIVGSLAGYGAWRLSMLREEEPKPVLLRAALVQADLSRYARLREELGTFDAAVQILERHFELSDQALTSGPVDVLVWPETVYPTTFGTPKSEEGAEFDRAIAGFSALRGVPLVFGAYDVEEGEEYNAAFFLAPGGDVAVYRKEALFPLTERVPVWLAAEPVRRWLPWLGTWRAGSGPRLVSMPLADGRTLRVGPLICYDAVDPLLARASARAGAELLVTLSNDSWFDVGSGPRLHLVVSAFRSIETRLPQIRATNTGITAAIDAEGTLLASLAVHQRDVLVAEVPAGPAVATLMLRWGDWLGPTALGGAGALLLAARVRACRSDDRNPARFRDPSRS
ncbi:apolipoprotein N-acyltransferase [Myxococcota bacterium]|nr:apolipoprotein N-acyltransferase [Myxococcota bacterium]